MGKRPLPRPKSPQHCIIGCLLKLVGVSWRNSQKGTAGYEACGDNVHLSPYVKGNMSLPDSISGCPLLVGILPVRARTHLEGDVSTNAAQLSASG